MPVNSYDVTKMYDEALKTFKSKMALTEKSQRPQKQGPVAFLAPKCAAALERDGLQNGLQTKVVTHFSQFKDVLISMKNFRLWVIVWPKDIRMEDEAITETVMICKKYLEEGGKILSVWPPVISKEVHIWKSMVELWSLLDKCLSKFAGPEQLFKTASARIEEGKVILEAGAPESSFQFYGTYCGVGNARYESAAEDVGSPKGRDVPGSSQ